MPDRKAELRIARLPAPTASEALAGAGDYAPQGRTGSAGARAVLLPPCLPTVFTYLRALAALPLLQNLACGTCAWSQHQLWLCCCNGRCKVFEQESCNRRRRGARTAARPGRPVRRRVWRGAAGGGGDRRRGPRGGPARGPRRGLGPLGHGGRGESTGGGRSRRAAQPQVRGLRISRGF